MAPFWVGPCLSATAKPGADLPDGWAPSKPTGQREQLNLLVYVQLAPHGFVVLADAADTPALAEHGDDGQGRGRARRQVRVCRAGADIRHPTHSRLRRSVAGRRQGRTDVTWMILNRVA
jgi:hypothetical protein